MQISTINSIASATEPTAAAGPIATELTQFMPPVAPTPTVDLRTRSFICNEAYQTAAIVIVGLLGLSSIVLVMMNHQWAGMGTLVASASCSFLIADCNRLSQKMSDIFAQKVQYVTAQGTWDVEKIEYELRSVKVLVFYPKRVQNFLYPRLIQRYFRNDQIGNV